MNPTLVIGVPGLWAKRSDPIAACAPRGYLWAGNESVVVDPATSKPYPFRAETYDPNPSMREAFDALSAGKISREVLDRIDAHTMTVYAVTNEPPSVDLCQSLMRFAGALLDAGGLAVKVETSGVAHAAERWRELLALEIRDLAAYQALTIRIAAADLGESYSCGMRHFGLPDAIMPGCGSETSTLDAFNKYMLLESPGIKDGQTFAAESGAPAYRLYHEPCAMFAPGHLYHNPFGVWRLKGPISSGTRRP